MFSVCDGVSVSVLLWVCLTVAYCMCVWFLRYLNHWMLVWGMDTRM